MKLAILLKQLRESRNLTIRQLSEKTGVGNGTIGEIERGKNKARISTLEKLSKGLSLSKQEREQLFSSLLPEDLKSKSKNNLLSLPVILKKFREEKGMTIIELSQKAELGKGTVGDMETGKSKGSLKSLKQISSVLNLSNEENDILESAFLERTSILNDSNLIKKEKNYSFEVEKDKAIDLGIYLRTKRKALGYSTNYLEIKTNINKADISRLENGKKLKINPLYLKELANALNLNQIELFNKVGFIDDIYLKETKASFDNKLFKNSGQIIREYRERKEMTTLELAKKLEVSQVFVTLLENNKRKLSKKIINKLSLLMSKEEIEKLISSEEYNRTPKAIKKKLIDLENENKQFKLNNHSRAEIFKDEVDINKEENLNEKIGAILRKKRKENNYSLEDLQYLLKQKYKLDLHISNISRYESGTVKNMNPVYVKSICKIIGLNYLEIFKKLNFIDNEDNSKVKDLKESYILKYEELLNQNALFFNDKSISEEDKKKMLDALTEAFYTIKISNKITK